MKSMIFSTRGRDRRSKKMPKEAMTMRIKKRMMPLLKRLEMMIRTQTKTKQEEMINPRTELAMTHNETQPSKKVGTRMSMRQKRRL